MTSDSQAGSSDQLLAPYASEIEFMRKVGNQCWNRGWSRGTSSNYSVRISEDPLRLLVTASGKDKGSLESNDFVVVDSSGKPSPNQQPKSSAETLLHTSIAKFKNAGAILHTHSVWSTLLSDHFAPVGGIEIQGYEMQKGLSGIVSHDEKIYFPIFENSQDIPKLATDVENWWKKNPNLMSWGYLIRRHGLYTWGNSMSEALRHLEVFEFLLECIGRRMSLS